MDSVFHSTENKYFINYFNNSPDAGLIVDKSTNYIIDANDVAVDLFNANSKHSIVNKKISNFLQNKIPESQSSIFKTTVKTATGLSFKARISLSVINIKEEQFMALFFKTTKKDKETPSLDIIDDEENKAYYDHTFINLPHESEATFNKLGFITGCNKELINLTNLTEDEIIGRPFTKLPFLNKKVKLYYLRHYKTLLKGNNVIPYYLIFYDKNKNKRNGVIRVAVIKEKNEVIGFQAILGDFTKQMHTRKTLIDNESKFKSIFRNLPVGVAHHDKDMNLTDCNCIFTDIFGLKKEEVIGLNLLDFAKSPEIKQTVNDLVKFGKGTYNSEYCPVISKETKYLRGFINTVKNTENENIGYIAIVEDVTEQKRTENKIKQYNKQLKLATKAAKQEIWTYDCYKSEFRISQSHLTDINANDKYTYISLDKWINLVHPQYREHVLKSFNDYISGHSNKFLIEYKVEDSGDKYVWYLTTGEIIEWHANKKPSKMIGIQTDITDLRRTEQQLIEQNEKLQQSIKRIESINKKLEISTRKAEESDRLKAAFLQNMSHEIRTPMNGIIGFAQLLEMDSSPTKVKKYIKIIRESSNQLLSIVNDILDISKIEAGQVELRRNKIQINQMLEYLYSFFEIQCSKKNISLVLENDTKKEIILYSDADKLRQILANLISNAIKYTHKGQVSFGYKTDTDKMIFFVKDTGIGIKQESLNMIFNRFSQAHSNNEILYGGTGLGLSISKALVELLGGEISVKSTIEIGSEFSFYLPFNK